MKNNGNIINVNTSKNIAFEKTIIQLFVELYSSGSVGFTTNASKLIQKIPKHRPVFGAMPYFCYATAGIESVSVF